MGEMKREGDLAGFGAVTTITARDVRRMREIVYADGAVDRGEAGALLRMMETATQVCREWHDFVIEAVTDHIVHQERPAGYISQENADWLVRAISRDGVVDTLPKLELLVTALEKAKSSPETLVQFALRQVADAVIDGKGPLAQLPGSLPNVVDRGEVDLLRRILYAFGGDGNVAITRAEAEVIFTINDRTVEEMNDPSWNELFVKAMASFVMGASGYTAPTRTEALRRDALFERADVDIGTFFSRMASGGISAILDAYAAPSGTEADWEARNIEKAATMRRAEVIDHEEAQWFAERMGKDRLLHDNERALLSLIKATSPSIHPALQDLIDRVA